MQEENEAQPTVIVIQPSQEDDATRYPNYSKNQSIGLGLIHLGSGLGCLVIAGLALHLEIFQFLSFSYNGIWIGIFFLICGSLGIAAGVTKLKKLIVAFLVFTILTIMFSMAGLCFAAYAMYFYAACQALSTGDNLYCSVLMRLSLAYLAISGLEFVVCIWSSAVGCAVSCRCCMCCCCCQGQTAQTQGTVVTYGGGKDKLASEQTELHQHVMNTDVTQIPPPGETQ